MDHSLDSSLPPLAPDDAIGRVVKAEQTTSVNPHAMHHHNPLALHQPPEFLPPHLANAAAAAAAAAAVESTVKTTKTKKPVVPVVKHQRNAESGKMIEKYIDKNRNKGGNKRAGGKNTTNYSTNCLDAASRRSYIRGKIDRIIPRDMLTFHHNAGGTYVSMLALPTGEIYLAGDTTRGRHMLTDPYIIQRFISLLPTDNTVNFRRNETTEMRQNYDATAVAIRDACAASNGLLTVLEAPRTNIVSVTDGGQVLSTTTHPDGTVEKSYGKVSECYLSAKIGRTVPQHQQQQHSTEEHRRTNDTADIVSSWASARAQRLGVVAAMAEQTLITRFATLFVSMMFFRPQTPEPEYVPARHQLQPVAPVAEPIVHATAADIPHLPRKQQQRQKRADTQEQTKVVAAVNEEVSAAQPVPAHVIPLLGAASASVDVADADADAELLKKELADSVANFSQQHPQSQQSPTLHGTLQPSLPSSPFHGFRIDYTTFATAAAPHHMMQACDSSSGIFFAPAASSHEDFLLM
jgi:hypothetical protein